MMKQILILNWRDPQSPLEGGAERFTKKYAQHWSKQGHDVTWITNSFPQSQAKEVIDGVTYIRIGPELDGSLFKYIVQYPIYLFKTVLFASKFIKEQKVDIVIDEIHGLPFFTPLFSNKRNILLVCEVAGKIWDKMFPFPVNVVGKYLEKLVYSFYKNSEIWAISENTKNNIQEIIPNTSVRVIELGIDENQEILQKIKNVKKTTYPSAVFLARLVKMKGIETAIYATEKIIQEFPDFKLFVIGDGTQDYKKHLKNLVTTLQLDTHIEFLGKVSEVDKFRYLKKAHFLFHPSYKEGFGLTVLEAGLVGTPTLARKGSSMDSLIQNGHSGYLFSQENEVQNYVQEIVNNNDTLAKHSFEFARKKLWVNVFKAEVL